MNRWIKSARFAWLLAVVLGAASLFFVWEHLTDECLEEASGTVDTILARMKTRSIDHSFLLDNDQAKSLMRLADKTREIASRERDMPNFSDKMLADYQTDQRLSGAVVLDGKLHPVYRVTYDDFSWQDVVRRDTVEDVLTYPLKQFADREEAPDGNVYDFAVTARKAGPGVVVAWEKKDLTKFGITAMDLYPGDAFAMQSLIFVVRNGRIQATNLPDWSGRLQRDCPYLTSPLSRVTSQGLHVHRVMGENWYGRNLQAKGHQIFVLIPEDALFQRRSVLFSEALFVFLLFAGILAYVRMRTSRRYVQQIETQLNTIKGISSIYISTYLVRLPEDTVEILQAPRSIHNRYRPGMRASEFFRIHLNQVINPEDVGKALAFFDTATLAERLASVPNLEAKLRLKDGRWVDVLAIPQNRNEYGTPTACLLMSRDISEEKERDLRVQQQLLTAAENAKSAAVAKVQFLRHMSHDVLDMSKLDAGGERLENVPFDVAEMMDELAETTSVIAKKQDVEIRRFMSGDDDWHVVGSRKHFRRICTNIIFNAVKFTPAGGTVKFGCRSVTLADGRHAVEFSCADTGRGMSEDFQKHVFEPFLQEDSAAARTTYQGTGLGLVITKQLTELMGGTITFVSKQGLGTTFTVTVPLERDRARQLQKAEETPVSEASVRGMRVLIAEDNDINMEIARFFLADAGVEATEARNGKEAVSLFEASPEGTFDLILMDIMMPETDGLAATRLIRALPRKDARTVPIIAMTANVFDDDVEESFRAGMNEHIAKPLDREKLLRVLSVFRAKEMSAGVA